MVRNQWAFRRTGSQVTKHQPCGCRVSPIALLEPFKVAFRKQFRQADLRTIYERIPSLQFYRLQNLSLFKHSRWIFSGRISDQYKRWGASWGSVPWCWVALGRDALRFFLWLQRCLWLSNTRGSSPRSRVGILLSLGTGWRGHRRCKAPWQGRNYLQSSLRLWEPQHRVTWFPP